MNPAVGKPETQAAPAGPAGDQQKNRRRFRRVVASRKAIFIGVAISSTIDSTAIHFQQLSSLVQDEFGCSDNCYFFVKTLQF